MALGWAPGCARDDEAVRGEVQRLALGEGSEGGRDVARLARHGRRALPFIEAGLHTAEPPGRRNLIAALRRIGDAEAAPLLMHRCAYDAAPAVRADARAVLEEWSAAPDPRGDRARAALRRLAELQAGN